VYVYVHKYMHLYLYLFRIVFIVKSFFLAFNLSVCCLCQPRQQCHLHIHVCMWTCPGLSSSVYFYGTPNAKTFQQGDIHKSLSMWAQIHTSKFHFRFAFVFVLHFLFSTCFLLQIKNNANCQVPELLSNSWLGQGTNNMPSTLCSDCVCQKCVLARRIN